MGRVIIVGAGVAGLGVALGLVEAGFAGRITLLEQDQEPGRHGSSRAAGALRRVGRAGPETELAVRALDTWIELGERFGVDVGIRRTGVLLVGSSAQNVGALAEKYDRQRDQGIGAQLIGPREIAELVPQIRPDVVLGLLCSGDGKVEPALATAALARIVLEDPRVELVVGSSVRELERGTHGWEVTGADGRIEQADIVVLAAGARTPALLDRLGLSAPISPARVVTLLTRPVETTIDPFFQDWDCELFLRQTKDGALQFGSLEQDFIDVGYRVSAVDRDRAIDALRRSLPRLGEVRIEREWAGVIDETRDRMPIVGPLPGVGGLFIAAGWSGHGFLLAPYVGRSIGRRIVEGWVDPHLESFDPARFAFAAGTSNVDA